MIFLLGETAAAREICSSLAIQGIQFIRLEIHERFIRVVHPTGEYHEEKPLGELTGLLITYGCQVVVDAAHPSSSVSFTALRQSCEQQGIPYVRLERPETRIPSNSLIHPVRNWDDGLLTLRSRVEELKNKEGRQLITVFVTTGSHQLESITQSTFARNIRLVVRILPQASLVQKCQSLGIPPRDIVAMQGPFSKELNRTLFKFYGADILLTRDSGPAGGTDTKISAALVLGLEIILLKRSNTPPGQIVYTVKELLGWLQEKLVL
ncbi:MAG: precorrin-6A reductase [Desulfitobacteriaceae bacterium]